MTRITKPFPDGYAGPSGRGWDRTSDLPRVKRVVVGGLDQGPLVNASKAQFHGPRPTNRALTTNSPQSPHQEGSNEKKRLVQAMELAGLEPATSWVRLAPGRFRPHRLGLLRRRQLTQVRSDSLSSVSRVVARTRKTM
jgi:hypothetical protein